MTDEQKTNHAFARSRSNDGLERTQFEEWATDGRRLGDMEMLFAWEAWKSATASEREACAKTCDAIAQKWRGANSQIVECATAIRERSNVKPRGAHK